MSSYSFQGRSRLWIPRDEEENKAIFSAMRQDTGITMPDEFKPIYLENEEYEVEKWSPKQLIKLLRLYGFHRCLWDHKDPFHKSRKMRKAAMIDITAAMGNDVTVEIVGQKINVIRSTYRYEKRRIKQRIKKGAGARTKLKWFALADSFLRNVPRSDKFKKTDASADSDSDLEDTIVFTIDPEILIPLEEDNSGDQNHITIGDDILPQQKTGNEITKINEINEQTDEIHQMLKSRHEDDFEKSNNETWKWKSKQSIKFLKVYREHKCLWDMNDPSFKDRSKKAKALKKIVKKIGDGMSEKQVIRKINALRSTYRSERRKIAEAYSRGEELQSRLKWYPLADSFLRPFCKFKLGKDSGSITLDNEPPQCEFMDDENDEVFNNDRNVSKDNDDENNDSGDSCNNDAKNNVDDVNDDRDNNNDDFHDSFSYDSEDEPIARLKLDSTSKNECKSSSDEVKKIEQPPSNRIPKIRIKPIKRPWKQTESIQFVELLRIHGCLWDKRHPNFKKLSERTKAFEDIAHKMDIPESRIRKKLKILIRTYHAERKKIELSREQGVPYETELVWFHLADEFLREKEEMPPPMLVAFVDPDLMSPAPSHFQEDEENKKIKFENTNSPKSNSPDHFSDDVVDSPATPDIVSDPPVSDSTTIKEQCPIPSSETILNSKTLNRNKVDTKPDDLNTNSAWSIPEEQSIKKEELPDEEFPKLETDEQPTKIVWNGLEDDLLEGKWSLKHSVKFLRLYGAHRCLWDLKSPDYRVRELRDAALEDIAAAMGHGLNVEYVSKKIKIFRITYMQHRKRMLEAIKSGQEPEIQLRWFPLADSFLRPHIGLRSIKSDEKELPQFDFQYVYANLNLIDPALLNDFEGKGTQNSIQLGGATGGGQKGINVAEQVSSEDEGDDDFDDGFFKDDRTEI